MLPSWLRPRAANSARRPFPEGGAIAFVTSVAKVHRMNSGQSYFSHTASTRLRVLIPALELARRVPVWLVPLETFAADPSLPGLQPLGAVVIGKQAVPSVTLHEAMLRRLVRQMRDVATATPLYADLSDDYAALAKALEEPFLAEYQAGLGACCTFTVPCQALAEAVRRDAKHGLAVVEDPYESSTGQAVRVAASQPLKLAWFGNLGEVNAAQVEEALLQIARGLADCALRFNVVADATQQGRVQGMAERMRAVHPNAELGFAPWSLETTHAALEACDFVLLPQEHHTAWGRVKSHNRLVTAIRAGRLAVASPIPAYQELADYAWVGEDLVGGLRWALRNPADAAERVRSGQRYVAERFSPDAVGRKWAAILGLPESGQ
jgi:hypothetical protein